MAQKLLRLKLVFGKFQVVISIIAQFLTIIALDLTKVIYRQMIWVSIIVFFLNGLIRLDCIDSSGQSRVILLALLLIILTTVFLFFLPSFSRKLNVVRIGQNYWNREVWAPEFRFFYLESFCCLGLRVGLSCSGVYWLVALMAILISVAADRDLYLDFNFDFGDFFN